MTTASMSLSSSTRRRSWTNPGLNVGTFASTCWSLIRDSARFASMSHSVLISTFFSCAKPRLSEFPCPRMPMLAVTTRSFAPRMRLPTLRRREERRPKELAAHGQPAAAAPSRDVKSRREIPSLLSFRSLATLTSFCIRARPVKFRRRILARRAQN